MILLKGMIFVFDFISIRLESFLSSMLFGYSIAHKPERR